MLPVIQRRIKKYGELRLLILGCVCQGESIITNIEPNFKEYGYNICFIHPLASGEACYTGIRLNCIKCIIYWTSIVTMPCSVSKEEIILLSEEIPSLWKVFNNGKPAPPPPCFAQFSK